MTETSAITRSVHPVAVDEDQILLNACLAGEEEAYAAVYSKYAGSIFRLCIGLLQHTEDSEEVMQDTFEYAFRKLDIFDVSRASFKTWLYQIAISRCRNKRRRKMLATLSLSQILNKDLVDDQATSPADSADLNERQRSVLRALSSLSPKLRETAILRYYGGFTYREIGQILTIPQKTAESRMRLAHSRLKELLSESTVRAER